MGKINFGLNVVAAIKKFKVAAYTKISNVILTCLIGFFDPENIGDHRYSDQNQVSMSFQY